MREIIFWKIAFFLALAIPSACTELGNKEKVLPKKATVRPAPKAPPQVNLRKKYPHGCTLVCGLTCEYFKLRQDAEDKKHGARLHYYNNGMKNFHYTSEESKLARYDRRVYKCALLERQLKRRKK